jgi:MFS superfamily sulfate permease-like transporter
MGVIFIVLGRLGVLDVAARGFPRALIRGVQLTVGLLFLKIAWGLVTDPPKSFQEHALATDWALPLALLVLVAAFALRRWPITLALVGAGAVIMVVLAGDDVALGPSAIALPHLDWAIFWTAFTVLVVPQVPLSFANSCLATADAARVYFGRAAKRVRPGRLATTFGSANLLAGTISGMPVCHGAGGMTAHYAFGARTAAAPAAMGVLLLVLALVLGAGLAGLLTAFPLPILAGVLACAGVLHITLLRDLQRVREWAVAILVGAIGFEVNLTVALVLGLALWWLPVGVRALPRLRTA